jgi:hypothetical protein
MRPEEIIKAAWGEQGLSEFMVLPDDWRLEKLMKYADGEVGNVLEAMRFLHLRLQREPALTTWEQGWKFLKGMARLQAWRQQQRLRKEVAA